MRSVTLTEKSFTDPVEFASVMQRLYGPEPELLAVIVTKVSFGNKIPEGSLGTIVEIHDNGFEVEFSGDDGRPLDPEIMTHFMERDQFELV